MLWDEVYEDLKCSMEFAGIELNLESILHEVANNLYQGASIEEVQTAVITTLRPLVEKEPDVTYMLSNHLFKDIFYNAATLLGLDTEAIEERDLLIPALKALVAEQRLNPEVLEKFDLKELTKTINSDKNRLLTFLSMQTLYDRYFIHLNNVRLETPQTFFMRVAMGLALKETNPTLKAIEFYEVLSSMDAMSSTPTLS